MSSLIKKINQNLLKKTPLLWNTRFPVALGIAILINIVYFLIGYAAFNYPKDLLTYSILSEEQLYILPSVLTSILFLIVWLYYYTQNNAFKSKFPLSKNYLRKEFFLILVLMFFNIIYMFSFMLGYRLHGHLDTNNIDLDAKIERANKAMMFLPIEHNDYNISGSCDSVFKEVEPRVYKVSLVDSMTNHFEDSLRIVHDLDSLDRINVSDWATRSILVQWGMMEDAAKESANEIRNGTKVVKSVYTDELEYAREEAGYIPETNYSNPKPEPKEYSYHYYCQNYFRTHGDGDSFKLQVSDNGRYWIRSKNKPAIKNSISAFLKDLDNARVKHNVNVEYWASMALKDSILPENFNVLERFHSYRREADYNYKQAIGLGAYNYYLDNTYELKEFPFRDFKIIEPYIAALSVALAFTFFIFLFRLNGIKPLLLSIVFGGVLSLVVSLVVFVFGIVDNDSLSIVLANVLAALILMAGIWAVFKRKRKLKAGIMLQLALVSLLIIPALIIGDILKITQPEAVHSALYSFEGAVSITCHSPTYSWITNNIEFLAMLYPFLIMAIVLFWFIPMSKKLRANPDE